MFTPLKIKYLVFLLILVCGTSGVITGQQNAARSQEISEVDGQPVLLQHLPEYDSVRSSAVFGTDKSALAGIVGNRAVLQLLEFPFGTEYVTANYPQGRLLIVEYTNPQSSIEADGKIQQYFNSKQNQDGEIYRRIGNY